MDNIYANSINEDITSGVMIADINDHFPIFSIIQHGTHKKETENIYLPANNTENICVKLSFGIIKLAFSV